MTEPAVFPKTVRKLLFFSSPMIFNTLLNMSPLLLSMWMLAQLGKEQLAAAAIAVPTFYTIVTIFMAGFYAIGIKVGHCYGENKKNREIGLWTRNGLFLALILGIPAIFILLNAHFLLLWFGQSPHLVQITKPFFFFGALNIIPMLINSTLTQYFSGIGHPRIVLVLSIITLPLVVILSYMLVLGHVGLPQLGLAGITCAVFIADSIFMLCAIGIVQLSKHSKTYFIFSRPLGINYQHCIELIKLGWPISIQVSGELAAMTLATYLLGLFGVSALAASEVVVQYVMVFIMISMGLEQGVTILVSQANGQKNLPAIQQITKAGIFLILLISSIFIFAFLAFSSTLMNFYLNIHQADHIQLVKYTIDFMKIAALYLVFDGVRHILTSTLRGLGDTKMPMKIGVGCLLLIGLPCAYLGGFIFHGGPVVLRLTYTIGVIIATIWLVYRYRMKLQSIFRKHKKTTCMSTKLFSQTEFN